MTQQKAIDIDAQSKGMLSTSQADAARSAANCQRSSSLSLDETAEPLSRVYSIGWSVSDRSISENDPRFICAVVASKQVLAGEGRRASAISKIMERQFVIEMHPKLTRASTDDVSGVLGFLSPWGSTEDREAHEQLERALSDLQMWALYACLKKEKSQPKGRSAILIQGPLLPKLRGRILYRMFDVENCSLYVVSSDPRWVNLLIKGNDCQDGASAPAGSDAIADQSARYAWTGPMPDVGLDNPMREFVGYRSGKHEVHVVVPANTLPARNASRFWTQCRQDLEELFKSPTKLDAQCGAMLPAVLCLAIDDAKESQDAILNALRGPRPMAPAAQTAAAAHGKVNSDSTSMPVQADLFGEAVPAVVEPLSLEWWTEMFELPSDDQLEKYQHIGAAKLVFQASRTNLLEALKEMSKSDRATAATARQRWLAYCEEQKGIAARKRKPENKIAVERSKYDWLSALRAKDAL
jgi:hypothetical protein